MTSAFRVDCQCGAMTFCQATVALPHTCAFCGRDLSDGTAARLRALRTGRGLSTAAVASLRQAGPAIRVVRICAVQRLVAKEPDTRQP